MGTEQTGMGAGIYRGTRSSHVKLHPFLKLLPLVELLGHQSSLNRLSPVGQGPEQDHHNALSLRHSTPPLPPPPSLPPHKPHSLEHTLKGVFLLPPALPLPLMCGGAGRIRLAPRPRIRLAPQPRVLVQLLGHLPQEEGVLEHTRLAPLTKPTARIHLEGGGREGWGQVRAYAALQLCAANTWYV